MCIYSYGYGYSPEAFHSDILFGNESFLQNDCMLKVRSGPQRKAPGFQAQLICLTPWTNGSHPGQITSLCINSSYGL